MKIGEKIKLLRERKHISPEKLGALIDISGIYIRRLEKGERETVTLATAEKLAKGLGVSPMDLLDETKEIKSRSPQEALSDVTTSIQAYIPVYGEVHAGEGMEPVDYVAMSRAKPAPETMKAYRVKGLCLEPDIRDGDTVIADVGLTPNDGDLVVCIIDGEISIKRYRHNKKGDYLENNGGTYRPEDCHELGVVTEINRKMR